MKPKRFGSLGKIRWRPDLPPVNGISRRKLQVRQLEFYRGYGECKASRWVSAAADLHTLMRKVSRVGGETQIECAFNPWTCRDRTDQGQVLVFVGDAMEERSDWLCHKAGELGRGGTPLFVPQKGITPSPCRPARLSAVHRPAVQPR